MAKDPKTTPEPLPVTETPPSPPKSYRLHILVGLVVVALLETIIIFLMFPSPDKLKKEITSLQNQVTSVDNIYNVSTEIKPENDLQKENLVEKTLGEKFKVQSTRPGNDQITDVFTVTIQVQIRKKDETAFDKIYTERQFAVRDAVGVVLRTSSLEDRKEVSLITIKRNVMKAVNEVLGTSYVKGVLCNDPIPETIQ